MSNTRAASAVRGSCHCGAVKFELAQKPAFVVSCNCSICRRLAALWVHAPPANVVLDVPVGATSAYQWGDKSLAFHSCNTCGCVTHWSGADTERMAVNYRLTQPADMADIRIRHFDGADSWEFLD